MRPLYIALVLFFLSLLSSTEVFAQKKRKLKGARLEYFKKQDEQLKKATQYIADVQQNFVLVRFNTSSSFKKYAKSKLEDSNTTEKDRNKLIELLKKDSIDRVEMFFDLASKFSFFTFCPYYFVPDTCMPMVWDSLRCKEVVLYDAHSLPVDSVRINDNSKIMIFSYENSISAPRKILMVKLPKNKQWAEVYPLVELNRKKMKAQKPVIDFNVPPDDNPWRLFLEHNYFWQRSIMFTLLF